MTEFVDVVCAWCNGHQGTKEMQVCGNDKLRGEPTQICESCVIEQFRGARVRVKDEMVELIGRTSGVMVTKSGKLFEVVLDGGGTVWRKADELELLRDQSD